jgi:hypothetical protein
MHKVCVFEAISITNSDKEEANDTTTGDESTNIYTRAFMHFFGYQILKFSLKACYGFLVIVLLLHYFFNNTINYPSRLNSCSLICTTAQSFSPIPANLKVGT